MHLTGCSTDAYGGYLEASIEGNNDLLLKYNDGRLWTYKLPPDVPPITDGNNGTGLGPYPYIRLHHSLVNERNSDIVIYWIDDGPVITRWTMWKTYYPPDDRAFILWDHRKIDITLRVIVRK